MAKNSFVIYDNWGVMVEALPNEMAGKIFKDLFVYRETGEIEEEDPALCAILALLTRKMDEDAAAYAKTCERNKKNRSGETGDGTQPNETTGDDSSRVVTTGDDWGTDTDTDTESDIDTGSDSEKPKHKARKRAEVVYDPDPEVNEAVKQFVRHRRVLKKPMTDYAVDRFLAKLRGMSRDPTEQVRLINTAIEHGWQTVYEDKKPEGKIDWSTV